MAREEYEKVYQPRSLMASHRPSSIIDGMGREFDRNRWTERVRQHLEQHGRSTLLQLRELLGEDELVTDSHLRSVLRSMENVQAIPQRGGPHDLRRTNVYALRRDPTDE